MGLRGCHSRFLLLACVLCLALTAAMMAQDAGVKAKASNHIFIVQMSDAPVVSYTGGVAGFRATKPGKGQKIDPNNGAVIAYAAYLDGKHNGALGNAGGGRKVYDYHYTFNGFAAELSDAQAAAMKDVAGVVSVTADELRQAVTSSTPAFLGLSAPGGLWDKLGGHDNAGEGIIIGDIDSGIWPENPSFSDRTGANGSGTQDGKLSFHQIPGWHGKCTPGVTFPASLCNQKLIGAQWFNQGYGGDAGIKQNLPWEFASARDYHGHGSHTASTAAGNHGTTPIGPAAVFGPVSGMAPRARIAMYKALWSLEDASQASGYNSDLVAAIDQAVADGVDVITYSISGTSTNFLDPVEVAFFYAADAGIFVVAAAGNSGPNFYTVNHPSPWLTTAAADTHNRSMIGTATLGNSNQYTGASTSPAAVTAPLIDAANAAAAGADPTKVKYCYAAIDNAGVAVLDPVKVAGKIVVCDRGVTARVNKSLAVLQAGGVGMILLNTSNNTLNADFHSVPSVHLQYTSTNYTNIHTYAAGSGATATVSKGVADFSTPAPYIASFSSRGPSLATGNLLKPDAAAPGQDILAAVAPPGNGNLMYNLYSGTSMSTPHIAGVAALLKQLHPDWTPMMIKSALMTSASDILDAFPLPTIIFSQGAGHIQPNKAADPGLVYDAGAYNWLAFLCGATNGVDAATCGALKTAGYSFDTSDLNVASIAIGAMAGSQTVTRRVTNVGAGTAVYNSSTTGLAGITVTVNPTTLTIAPGQTKSYTVTFTRTTAALGTYTGGQLTWTDGTHNVRIPIVFVPVALAAPAQVNSNGSAISYNVKFGFAGPFGAVARGLVPATPSAGQVSQDPGQSFTPGGPGTTSFDVAIPSGTTYARFSLFDSNTSPASDLDLYVYRGSTRVGSSSGGTANEEVDLINPTAGTYTVWVHGFNTNGGTTSFTMFPWVLGSTAAGNMLVSAPATATIGGTGTINLTFNTLTPGTKYLGAVDYTGAAGLPSTYVRVDP